MTRDEDLTIWEDEIDNYRQWKGDDTPIVAVAWRNLEKGGGGDLANPRFYGNRATIRTV